MAAESDLIGYEEQFYYYNEEYIWIQYVTIKTIKS